MQTVSVVTVTGNSTISLAANRSLVTIRLTKDFGQVWWSVYNFPVIRNKPMHRGRETEEPEKIAKKPVILINTRYYDATYR